METKLNTPLTAEEIDFRVQSINKGGYATILAYKDARVDMKRLDDVFGVEYWQKKYEEEMATNLRNLSDKFNSAPLTSGECEEFF